MPLAPPPTSPPSSMPDPTLTLDVIVTCPCPRSSLLIDLLHALGWLALAYVAMVLFLLLLQRYWMDR